jgi:uncharacterized protein (TIGR02453 family)
MLTRDAADFLAALRENNERTWFQAHRDQAETLLMAPARDLVATVGERLRKKRPDLIADPRVDRSIYRLNRDTRFSRDKTPYKTHLALWWWEGTGGRLECPGFYFHLTPETLGLSFGCYRFSEAGLANWRKTLDNPKEAARLQRLVKELEGRGACFSEPERKRVPAGLAAGHPAARWLRHLGFYSWEEFPHPPEIFGPHAADYLCERFVPGLKLHAWLVKTIG